MLRCGRSGSPLALRVLQRCQVSRGTPRTGAAVLCLRTPPPPPLLLCLQSGSRGSCGSGRAQCIKSGAIRGSAGKHALRRRQCVCVCHVSQRVGIALKHAGCSATWELHCVDLYVLRSGQERAHANRQGPLCSPSPSPPSTNPLNPCEQHECERLCVVATVGQAEAEWLVSLCGLLAEVQPRFCSWHLAGACACRCMCSLCPAWTAQQLLGCLPSLSTVMCCVCLLRMRVHGVHL